MKESLVTALRALYVTQKVTEQDRPEIPPTRDELQLHGVTKAQLKKLEAKGLCKSEVIVVREGSRVCGRPTYTLTSTGDALCTSLFGRTE